MKKEIELLDEFEDESPLTVDVDKLPVIVRVEPMKEDMSSSNGTILLEDSSLFNDKNDTVSDDNVSDSKIVFPFVLFVAILVLTQIIILSFAIVSNL